MSSQTVTYIVYRNGSNAANQSMTQSMPVGAYEGVGETAIQRGADATEKAAAEHIVYVNQWLSARPASRCPQADVIAAWEHQEHIAGVRRESDLIAQQIQAELDADPYADPI